MDPSTQCPRPSPGFTRGAPSRSTAVARDETLVCITSIVTGGVRARAVPGPTQKKKPGAPWAPINTCTKTLTLPAVRPCAWADLPQARAIRALSAGSTLQLVGRDLCCATVLPYVLEAVRAGAAVRLCFVQIAATGAGAGAAESSRQSALEHTLGQFTVADVLSVAAVAEDGRPLDVGTAPVCALCLPHATATTGMMRCARCKCCWYCSKAHQTAHWSAHEAQCTRSVRAIEGSAAMAATFCPLAQYHTVQYHTAEAIPIPLVAPPPAVRPARPAAAANSIDTFQLTARGIQQQIRDFLDRQQRRAVERKKMRGRGDRVRALENGSFIPLIDASDPTEPFFHQGHRPSTPPAPSATAASSSICCGHRQHDGTRLLPRLQPPPERDGAARIPSTPLCTYFGAPAPRKRKWQYSTSGDADGSASTRHHEGTAVSHSARRPRTDVGEESGASPTQPSAVCPAELKIGQASVSPSHNPTSPPLPSLPHAQPTLATQLPPHQLCHNSAGKQRPSGGPADVLRTRIVSRAITVTRLPECKVHLGITIKNHKMTGQSATSSGEARTGAAIKTVQAGFSGDVAGLRPGMFIIAVDHERVPMLSQSQIDDARNPQSAGKQQSAKIAKALIANAIQTHGKVSLTVKYLTDDLTLAFHRPSGSSADALGRLVITVTRLPQCKTSTSLGIAIRNHRIPGRSDASPCTVRTGATITQVKAGFSGDVAGLQPGMVIVAVGNEEVPMLTQQEMCVPLSMDGAKQRPARIVSALIATAIQTHGEVTLTIN